MDLSQVVKGNSFLSLSSSLLDPFEAELGVAPQVNHGSEGTILDKFFKDGAVDFILGCLHVSLTVHNLPKDVAISEGRSFREVELLRLFSNGSVPEEGSGVDGVELEGEGPPFGI
jgi:hypothetical protein